MGDRVEEGLILSWCGGTSFEQWRLDFIEFNVLADQAIPSNSDLADWYNDSRSDEWECMIDELDTLIKGKFSGYWWAVVTNFGWQHLDGYKEFTAEDGRTFLQELLPQTDCHFKIYMNDSILGWRTEADEKMRGLRVQNFHHDSPMGNEVYYVLDVGDLMRCSECEKWFLEGDYYEHTWEDEYGPCVEHDESVCQTCGEKLYEEDDDDTDQAAD